MLSCLLDLSFFIIGIKCLRGFWQLSVSGAVSVKMNVLLYAPPLLLLMLKVHIYVQYLSGYVTIFFFVSLHRNAHVACFLHVRMQAMDISGVLLALAWAAVVQVPCISFYCIFVICETIVARVVIYRVHKYLGG